MKVPDQTLSAIGSADRRASLENPSTSLADADDWLYDALGGSESSSGVRVNAQTALALAALWRGVQLVARDVAKIPLAVFERIGEQGRRRASEHPAYRLLRRRANAEQTAFSWKQQAMGHVLLAGNAYSYIVRRGDGTPLELVPLLPDRTWPIRRDGQLWYLTEVPIGEHRWQPRRLPPEDVLHVKGLGFDGLSGYSVIRFAAESLGIPLAAQTYGAKFFKHDATPRVVLEHPGKLTEQAIKNILQGWDRFHAGLSNAHRTALLMEGMKAQKLSIDAKDAQLVETLQWAIRDVANWIGVPPHKLGAVGATSYASLEQENQSYLSDTLDGWFATVEEECTAKLFSEREIDGDTHFCEFNRRALVRADTAARASFFRSLWMIGAISQDEIRAAENMNPIPGGKGSAYYVPLNMVPGSAEPADERSRRPASTGRADELRRACRRIVIDAAGRMCRRLAVAAARAKGELALELEQNHRATVAAALGPALAAAAAAGGRRISASSAARRLIREASRRLAQAEGREAAAAALEAEWPRRLAQRVFNRQTEDAK